MKNRRFILTVVAAFVVFVALTVHAAPPGEHIQTEQAPREPGTRKTVAKEGGTPASVEDAFQRMYPQMKFDAITPTDINGIYEVTAGANIVYFVPEGGYLIVGEIRGRGVNITANRKDQLVAVRNRAVVEKVKSFPLDKAVKIGNGKNTVIEFTDPDCPYCRKASEFFAKRTDVTRYVFFMPLPGHPDAVNKIKYVLCSDDKARAYEEAMTGKLDNRKYEICEKPEVNDLAALYKDLAARAGVNSTPYFIVNDTPVTGADIPRLTNALK